MQADKINELIKCSQNEAYFILTYFKASNPFRGVSTLQLELKQLNILNKIVNKGFIIDHIEERQIGTSTILIAHALWLALFHPDQRIVIMSHTMAHTTRLRDMFQQALDGLPEFLQPKILTNNARSIELENDSWVHYINGDPERLRGFHTTCLIADTFESFKYAWQRDLRQHAEVVKLDTVMLLKG